MSIVPPPNGPDPDATGDGGTPDAPVPPAEGYSPPEHHSAPAQPYPPQPEYYSAPGQLYPPQYAAAPGYSTEAYPAPTSAATLPYPPVAPRASQTAAIAALITGIVAVLLCFLPLIGLGAGIAAIILGAVALTRRQRKGFAITGIVLGAIGALASVAVSIGLAFFFVTSSTVDGEAIAPSPSATPAEEPSETEEPESSTPRPEPSAGAVDLSGFSALDDAGLAAIVADPAGHYGERYVVYGEVQQYDHLTGECQLYIWIDDAEQAAWEGYETEAWAWAASSEEPDTQCLEFEGIRQLSHLKLYVTILGQSTIEFDDGAADLLSLDVHQVETLPDLPQ